MKLNQFKNKNVLILGLGWEGQDSFLFLRKIFPEKKIGLADQLKFEKLSRSFQKILKKDKKIQIHLGKNYLKSLKKYEVIIKAPGIPLRVLKPYLKKEQIITSQTKIFFENCPGKIIGVAGTKGKGTTASLIYKILKTGGIKTYLVGNIGKPALSFLLKAKKIFVYELSSFQLMDLKKSPQIAVFLNTWPDHLDYHKNLQEYIKANAKITEYQKENDFLIYNSQDEIIKKIAEKSKAQKIPIKGRYYLLNLQAAKKVGKIFKIPKKTIFRAIKEFKRQSHRLELVGQFKEIKFYDDSASTIPETTIAAIDALGKKLKTIILGGSEKNLDFRELGKKITKSQIKTVILFPVSGERIWQAIRSTFISQGKNLPKHFFVDKMQEAVKLAYQYTQKGEICLLSPGSASFGLFRDYKERGNLFKKWVKFFAKPKQFAHRTKAEDFEKIRSY